MLIGESFPPLGKICVLLSYDSLLIDVDSTLKGVLSTPLGKFHFATLKGAAFVSWTHRVVLLRYIILMGIWLMILTHGGAFLMIFNPLIVLLMLSVHWDAFECLCALCPLRTFLSFSDEF